MITAHPVGQEKKRAVIFRMARPASVRAIGIAIPLADRAFIRREHFRQLGSVKAVLLRQQPDIKPMGIAHRPFDQSMGIRSSVRRDSSWI